MRSPLAYLLSVLLLLVLLVADSWAIPAHVLQYQWHKPGIGAIAAGKFVSGAKAIFGTSNGGVAVINSHGEISGRSQSPGPNPTSVVLAIAHQRVITIAAEEASNETIIRGFSITNGALEWEERVQNARQADIITAAASSAQAKTPFVHLISARSYHVRNAVTGAFAGGLAAASTESFAALRVLPAPAADSAAPHAEVLSVIEETGQHVLLWRVLELSPGKKPANIHVPPLPQKDAQVLFVPATADSSLLVTFDDASKKLSVIARGASEWSTHTLKDLAAGKEKLTLEPASGSDGHWKGFILRGVSSVYAYALADSAADPPRLLLSEKDAVSVSPLHFASGAPFVAVLSQSSLSLVDLSAGRVVHRQETGQSVSGAGVAARVLDASVMGGAKTPTAFRVLIQQSDLRVQALLVNVSGSPVEVLWQRDEGLSQWVTCIFADLPPPPPAQLLSWSSVTTLLQRFDPQRLWQSSRPVPNNYADLYGMERAVIGISSAGVLYALNTLGGGLLWRSALPLVGASRYELLFLKGTGLVVLGVDAQQRYVMLQVDHHDGRVLHTHVLPYSVQLVVPLRGPHTSKGHDALLLVDSARLVHPFPYTDATVQLVRESTDSAGFYIADQRRVVGYGFARGVSPATAMESIETWRLEAGAGEEIVSVTAPEEHEVLGGETVRLNDGSYLRKVLAPSILVLLRNGSHTLRALRVDTRGGNVLSAHTHTSAAVGGARGAAAAAVSENWHMYTYWNTRLHRHEVSIVELYHPSSASLPTSGSDEVAKPAALNVVAQSYVLPVGPYGGLVGGAALAVSQTKHGITPRVVVAATRSGQLLTLERRFLDARRRPRDQIPPEEMQDAPVYPYHPVFPLPPQTVVSANVSLLLGPARIVRTGRAGLESISHLVAVGTDLFYSQLSPGSTFDRMQEDFNFVALAATLGGLLLVTMVLSYFSARSDLARQWK